jgi:hypothetical protein
MQFILFATTYMTLGLFMILFSREIAEGMNRFSLKFYEWFPKLKKMHPFSRFAGSALNYRTTLYVFRGFGGFMVLVGVVFLGLLLLDRRFR